MGVQIPSNMPHPEHSCDVAVKAEPGWGGDGEPTFENKEQELVRVEGMYHALGYIAALEICMPLFD